MNICVFKEIRIYQQMDSCDWIQPFFTVEQRFLRFVQPDRRWRWKKANLETLEEDKS